MCIYHSIIESSDVSRSFTRTKAEIENIIKRMDKLLDLNIHGHISDEEFVLRNQRFNRELDEKRQYLLLQEREYTKQRENATQTDILKERISDELQFAKGYSVGIIDALVNRVDMAGTTKDHMIPVCIYLKAGLDTMRFLVRRRRGNTSVCSRQYI